VSGHEHEQAPQEQRSKIKVSRNAKGDPQWEITVLVGEEASAVGRAREIALEMHRAMEQEFGIPARPVHAARVS
jgi:hypothetical protein